MVYNPALTAQILILNDCAAEKYCNALNKILSYINDHQVSRKMQESKCLTAVLSGSTNTLSLHRPSISASASS